MNRHMNAEGSSRPQLPMIAADVKRLTEKEARVIGATAMDLQKLRALRNEMMGGGSVSFKTKHGLSAFNLDAAASAAVMALLLERLSLVLIQFDVQLEEPIE
jgi:hypothetical protein